MSNKKGQIGWVITIVIIVMLLFFSMIIGCADSTFYAPKRADNAQKICIDRGYDNYQSFKGIIFETKALGVKCEEINYVQKSIDTEDLSNNNDNIIVVT